MDKDKLDLIVEDRLLSIIKEERGISDTVVQWSKILLSVLQIKIRLSKSEPISRDYVTFKKGDVLVDLGKVKLPVRWFYYNFMDNATKEKNEDLLSREPNGINRNGLSITIYSVNNIIDTDSFENTIGHELLHLFQTTKSHKIFSNTELYRNENDWKNSSNHYLMLFGNILYLSNKFEQDAYNHGLYMSMINCKWHDDLFKVLKNDQMYHIIMYLTEAVDELENSKLNKLELETALNVIKNYNYTFEKIIRTAKNAIKRFNYILARTYDKAERDWKKEHMISEFYNFKQNNTVENNRLSILDEIIN
jgi:hypothetical protein